MRVAHLTTVDMSLRYLLFPQLLAVAEAGGEAVGISAPGPWVAELEQAGIHHASLPSSTRGVSLVADLRAALQLWRVLRRERPLVLHTHNPKPGLYGRILGRLSGVPLVVNTVHGLYATEDDRWMKRLIVYALEAVAARFSDAELFQNPEDLEFCLRWHVTPRRRGRLLGNGVDLERFDPDRIDPAARQRIRRELEAGDDQIVVGMVGRLVAEKGYPELFEAASMLGERYVVAAIGPADPDKPDALPQEALSSAAEAGVRFLGMRTDMTDLYSAMDVFALPSHREGFPRAAMEAAAMGVPVVATNVRGCRQVVEHGVSGLLVSLRDPAALAAALRTVGDDPELRHSMSSASRRRALEHFDERRVVEIVMETYRQRLAAKGLSHLLPAGMRETGLHSILLRPAVRADATALADLHATHISGGFLPVLGSRFMRLLYRALIGWKQAVVLVADDGTGPVGFAAGVPDLEALYRHFLRRYSVPAALAALPHLLRPRNILRAWETIRYVSSDVEARGEFLSMVVAPVARGRGLAVRLGGEVLETLRERGAGRVRVVVGDSNHAALAAYRKMGFAEARRFEMHAGKSSVMLVRSAA